jgi:competence protein ComEA
MGSVQAGQPGKAQGEVSAPTTEIVVSVTGLVERPGVVTLSAVARVADAVAAAGGAVEGADLTGLNLAARLADGDSVVVGGSASPGDTESGVTGAGGGQGAATTPGDQNSAGGLVDLNTADEAALDTLPGVGPVMAQNILAWREANGKFTTVEQLQEISGIGPSRYAQISPLVTVS